MIPPWASLAIRCSGCGFSRHCACDADWLVMISGNTTRLWGCDPEEAPHG